MRKASGGGGYLRPPSPKRYRPSGGNRQNGNDYPAAASSSKAAVNGVPSTSSSAMSMTAEEQDDEEWWNVIASQADTLREIENQVMIASQKMTQKTTNNAGNRVIIAETNKPDPSNSRNEMGQVPGVDMTNHQLGGCETNYARENRDLKFQNEDLQQQIKKLKENLLDVTEDRKLKEGEIKCLKYKVDEKDQVEGKMRKELMKQRDVLTQRHEAEKLDFLSKLKNKEDEIKFKELEKMRETENLQREKKRLEGIINSTQIGGSQAVVLNGTVNNATSNRQPPTRISPRSRNAMTPSNRTPTSAVGGKSGFPTRHSFFSKKDVSRNNDSLLNCSRSNRDPQLDFNLTTGELDDSMAGIDQLITHHVDQLLPPDPPLAASNKVETADFNEQITVPDQSAIWFEEYSLPDITDAIRKLPLLEFAKFQVSSVADNHDKSAQLINLSASTNPVEETLKERVKKRGHSVMGMKTIYLPFQAVPEFSNRKGSIVSKTPSENGSNVRRKCVWRLRQQLTYYEMQRRRVLRGALRMDNRRSATQQSMSLSRLRRSLAADKLLASSADGSK